MPVTPAQLKEIDLFFATAKLPATILLVPGTMIDNVSEFVESHLTVLREGGLKQVFEGFYLRMMRLRELIAK